MKKLVYALSLLAFLLLKSNAAVGQCTAEITPNATTLSCIQVEILLNGSSNVVNATYAWSGPNGFVSAQQSVSVNIPGTYALTVTDTDNGCTATGEIAIAQNLTVPVPGTAQVTNACDHEGAISYPPNPDYSYYWSNGATGPAVYNLFTGVYCVTVEDNTSGCTVSECFTVEQLQPALVSSNVSNPVGGQHNGLIVLAPIPQGTPLTYFWTGPNGFTSNSPVLQGLGPGIYNVTVTNTNSGCTGTYTYSLASTGGGNLAFTNINVCDGMVFLEWTFTLPTYLLQWDGPEQGSQTTASPGASVALSPGVYDFSVEDSGGGKIHTQVTVPVNAQPCTFIEGDIAFDADQNCQIDSGELGLAYWVVRATGNGVVRYAMSDADGHYRLRCNPGAYVVHVEPQSPQALPCANDLAVQLTQIGDSVTVDFPIHIFQPDCPTLAVDLGCSALRRCFDNNYYHITYHNIGAAAATDAYLLLDLDPFLSIVSTSIPYTPQGGTVYRFELGTVAPGTSGNFWVRVQVSCDAVLGQTHCTDVHIYPDTLCLPPDGMWSGAIVEAAHDCEGDSLHFILKNVGNGPMSVPLEYIVIEDGSLGIQGVSQPLNPGTLMDISVPANGSTWRIEAKQEPFAPTFAQPVLSVEGCTGTGSFTTGFVTQFPFSNGNFWEDTDCRQNVASFDPNDKQGFPTGFGPKHYIRPGTELEYVIRFQNTGTDTAFNVALRDTLSAWLDPASIRPGASSHPYRIELTGTSVLTFDFQNILLPDSNVNEVASHGYVQFRIKPRTSVPLETDILNRAAIYFDFNDPVLTNTTVHRIGENFVTVGLWQPSQPGLRIEVAPNPLHEASWVRLVAPGPLPMADDSYRLHLFDPAGRPVRELSAGSPAFLLRRENLPGGVYFFRIETPGGMLGTGKLVIR